MNDRPKSIKKPEGWSLGNYSRYKISSMKQVYWLAISLITGSIVALIATLGVSNYPIYFYIALFITFVLIYLLIWRNVAGAWDLSDTRLWFAGLFLLYGVTEPLVRTYHVKEDTLIMTSFIFLLGAVGLVVSILLSRKGARIEKEIPLGNINFLKLLRFTSAATVILGFVAFVYHFSNVGMINALALPKSVVFDVQAKSSVSRLNLPYLPLLIVGLNGYLFTLLHWPKRNNRIAWLAFISILLLLIGFWIGFGDRRSIFFLFVSLLGISSTKFGFRFSLTKILVIVVLIVVLFSFIDILRLTTLIRGGDVLLSKLRLKEIFSEFANPYGTLILAVRNDITAKYGATYIQAFPNLIPRLLYPGEKPLVIEKAWRSMWLPQLYPKTNRVPGLGFLPVTEAYINFGLFGPPMILFVMGILLNWMVSFKNGRSIYRKLLYGPLLIQVFNLNRACFAVVIHSFFYLWIITTLLYGFTRILQGVRIK